jgi:RNA polymerase sigma-70 factor (ECF subfamily)
LARVYNAGHIVLKVEPSSDATLSDAELMRRIADGDMGSFAMLIRRHQDYARTLAYRVTGAADAADDITQETFLRVLRSARSYTPAAAFTTWLHRIIVNLCLDRAKRPKLAHLLDDQVSPDAAPDEPITQQERIAAIRHEIDALTDRQRIVLVLHRFQGLSHSEIAQSTGWSVSAIEALLVRAYTQLRERLKPWQT